MYAFEYKKAASLDDAKQAFDSADDGTYMAGGMTLIPTLKQRLASPSDVIDLGSIADLGGITVDGDTVTIGAMTCHADVAASAEVKKAIPALAHLASLIGDPQVRNRGTIGGSIANNDPAADYPGALVGLGATVHTTTKTVSADEFFTGMFETALDEGELVTKVSFPIPESAAYQKFPNPASRYAVVGAFVAKTKDGIRVAITGAGPTVFRVPEMELALTASFTPEAIADNTVPADNLNGDLHATAEYRAHLIGVMAKRAVADCA
ncbi:MAG: xanthine dehydrogenase family protein subunit M [Rhodospirillaceae bacterium]|jgi:aerobic carbon-monoxide dehydrogenase medium subunit|nr:xanthine dehydrogenase family protein subunit M [Rhodospirillaceae bacterium]MBT5240169.1 xanthine dehydrogenase family protein subunit M [Rhodospirillaceae bacterium]MBT5566948.1 xanthine dehydrogenase family protein subunit M [Rhodospirillaceae bacterium]MBT6090365.1 xanthine dehydrogenase family protein subunit M [Rhodospirillaceae bacterium]MBT6962309.1 xanthine dehydrogenase family protein subunit M [Rhodospirillaceae bacterium]